MTGLIKELLKPIEPIPTGETPRLNILPGLRAVLFDVYGTLLVSGSGDVGTVLEHSPEAALQEALVSTGLDPANGAGKRGVALMYTRIAETHGQMRALGVDFPEVEIRAIWRDVLAALM